MIISVIKEYLKYNFFPNSVATVSLPFSNSIPSFSKISQASSNAFTSYALAGLNLVLIVSCFLNIFFIFIIIHKNKD